MSDLSSLSHLPSHILLTELSRRQDDTTTSKPTCGTSGRQGNYNTPLHVFALFLILGLSTLACSFPIIARRFPSLPIPHRFLFLSRHFGTGVLIATAFIHLLPTAFVSLTDPCLPDFWNKSYPPMAGAIAMLAVFLVVTTEMFFATRGAGHNHDSDWTRVPETETPGSEGLGLRGGEWRDRTSHRMEQMGAGDGVGMNGTAHIAKDDGEDEEDLDLDLENLDPITQDNDVDDDQAALTRPNHFRHNSHAKRMEELATTTTDPQKLFLQCLLLEAGILFHSIFIGMAVSVATGTAFIVLLIAICFHQTFEGFALGSRIAALIPSLFPASSPKPWLMALAYGTTTPIGQALGIWLHGMYDPLSETGLILVGVTNAISSGLLLFAGLVQLIAEDFLSDESYKTLKGRRRIEASLAVGLGGLLMAIVGAFA
jgi:ZIP zinc/iron transport family